MLAKFTQGSLIFNLVFSELSLVFVPRCNFPEALPQPYTMCAYARTLHIQKAQYIALFLWHFVKMYIKAFISIT